MTIKQHTHEKASPYHRRYCARPVVHHGERLVPVQTRADAQIPGRIAHRAVHGRVRTNGLHDLRAPHHETAGAPADSRSTSGCPGSKQVPPSIRSGERGFLPQGIRDFPTRPDKFGFRLRPRFLRALVRIDYIHAQEITLLVSACQRRSALLEQFSCFETTRRAYFAPL